MGKSSWGACGGRRRKEDGVGQRELYDAINAYTHKHRHIHSRQAPGSAAKGQVAHTDTDTHDTHHTQTREQTCSASEHLAQIRRRQGDLIRRRPEGERESMNPSPGLCCTTTLPTHVSNMHVKPVFCFAKKD